MHFMLIEAKNLWKIYGSKENEVNALKGVNLNVNEGDFLALLGPSGCGKSTLLHILGAMDNADRGEIIMEGKILGDFKVNMLNQLRLRRIGFIFQTFNLMPTLSAIENVMLPMKLAGLPRRVAREKAYLLLEEVGLGDRMKHLPAQLSGGQKQRVAIARALANDPALILADEPTGNLDSESGEMIMQLLQKLSKQGHTIIMVTHNAELADRVGRVAYMRDGQLKEMA